MFRRNLSVQYALLLVALVCAAALFVVRTFRTLRQPLSMETERPVSFRGRSCIESRVMKVPNAEEIWLASGKRVVIQGADSPKGREVFKAKAALEKLVLGRSVVVCPCGRSPRDRHGRWRAQVFVGGRSVAELLLKRCLVDLHYYARCDSEIADELYAAYLEGWKRGLNRCRDRLSIDASEAGRFVGKPAVVSGRISHVRKDRNPLIFNMDGFKVVVFRDDLERIRARGIDPEDWDAGMRLKVFGRIEEYGGAEVILRSGVQVLEIFD